MNQHLRMIDRVLDVLWDTEIKDDEGATSALVWVDYVWRQLSRTKKLDDLSDVKYLCQLHEYWYRMSTKHLTFANDAGSSGCAVERVLDLQSTYTRFAEVIGEVRQKIAVYETRSEDLVGIIASDMFALTH